MATLTELSTPTPEGDQFVWDVPDGWQQGRGAFGGLTIATLVRALEARIAEPARRLRSLTAELPGPVMVGRAAIHVDTLRAGKNVTTARVALDQNGVQAHAVGVFATARKSTDEGWQELIAPVAPPADSLAVIPHNPLMPVFTQHLEIRVAEGIPMSGKRDAKIVGYVAARDPGTARDAAHIAAMMDVFWPVMFVRFTTLRPIATIAYTLEIVADPTTIDPRVPLLYRAVAPVLHDGYSLEQRELWTPDGKLVAINHQTLAVIA